MFTPQIKPQRKNSLNRLKKLIFEKNIFNEPKPSSNDTIGPDAKIRIKFVRVYKGELSGNFSW
jgi:hypothetical protein